MKIRRARRWIIKQKCKKQNAARDSTKMTNRNPAKNTNGNTTKNT